MNPDKLIKEYEHLGEQYRLTLYRDPVSLEYGLISLEVWEKGGFWTRDTWNCVYMGYTQPIEKALRYFEKENKNLKV